MPPAPVRSWKQNKTSYSTPWPMLPDPRCFIIALNIFPFVGIEPVYRTIQDCISPVSFVISLNLKRRHLDSTQRAIAAEKALPMFEVEAKERQRGAGKRYGEKHPKEEITEKIPEALEDGEAREQVTTIFNTKLTQKGKSSGHPKE